MRTTVMSKGEKSDFSFCRDQFYRIGEMRVFHAALLEKRQQSRGFSAAVRDRKLPWAKLWTEEVFPLLLYANHHQLPDEDEFRIMPEGHPVDAELRLRSEEIVRFQITMAYAEWNPPRSGGYIASMERDGANQGAPVFLGGKIRKDAGDRISSEPRLLSPDIDCRAWRLGLIKSVKKKISKGTAYARGVDCLLVYAEKLWFSMGYENVAAVILSAIRDVLPNTKMLPFRQLIILDQPRSALNQLPEAYVFVSNSPCPTAS